MQLADAQQQHRAHGLPNVHQGLDPGGRSQQVTDDAKVQWAATHVNAADISQATAEARQVQKKRNVQNIEKRNKNYDNTIIPQDASALATLAPAEAVRAPNTFRHQRPSSVASGLSSPQIARSLKNWEVEDFVLLATVDGDLYANDRRTGKERWHLEVDQPMIETKHHRQNHSVLDDDYDPVDHYVWAIEPNRDGGIYLWMPDSEAGIVPTGLSMKRIVEALAPYAPEEPRVVYTGDKKTTMITLDAATGRVLKWFGSGSSHVNEAESCLQPDTLYNAESEECSSTGTITLGRTEYTVTIQRRDNSPIATLKYSEWSPNSFDHDLLDQHHASLDSKYITSQHDGKVYGFDYARSAKAEPFFREEFSAPVARVFDVCRPWDATLESNPDLVVLPQPSMPSQDEKIARLRSDSIFLNQTRSGSWFAMSGRAYPLIIHAPEARLSRPEWRETAPAWDTLSEDRLSKALVGTHYLGAYRDNKHQPAISGPPADDEEIENHSNVPSISEASDEPTIITKVKSFPHIVARSITDFISNPILIIILCGTLIYNEKNLRRSYNRMRHKGFLNVLQQFLATSLDAYPDNTENDVRGINRDFETLATPVESFANENRLEQQLEENLEREFGDKTEVTTVADKYSESVPVQEVGPPTPAKTPIKEPEPSDDDATPRPKADPLADKAVTVPVAVPTLPQEPQRELDEPQSNAQANIPNNAQNNQNVAQNGTPGEKKKKAHRGRRGGVKHRKGRARELSQSRDDDPNPGSVEDAVNNAKKLGDGPNLEPDVMTVDDDMQSVTGSIIRLGNIEVNTEEQLGTGSNGTLVFAGKIGNRNVAVKRMLIQFYDIASQETRLLEESDNHANGTWCMSIVCICLLTFQVVTYYSQHTRDGFLYIALERCAASLADVIEKPYHFRELAQAGEQDKSMVLWQITHGISHLHSLRIVHRDLKPQNILVNMGKNGKPKMLVSDFGLCKKLEGGQSSFGATTGRAAGTSGWRAPELLIDDDARDSAMTETSIQSGSGSVLVNDGMMPNNRRATRAIDIFSLGLVFFYVLTNGSHPFDCGDRYMREVNIRKGNFNLSLLDSLGESAYEAKDLISQMLQADPKQRPTADEVKSHPFFWDSSRKLGFLVDASDHYEREPRDPPSPALNELERHASRVIRGDFLRMLPRDFVDCLGKQRKYTGTRLLDLLRALRNKKNHYEDMPDTVKRLTGPLDEGYLVFWTVRFPMLLIMCWNLLYDTERFKKYYLPVTPEGLV